MIIAASNLAHNCTFLADVQVSFTLQMHVQWLSLLTRAFSKTFRQPFIGALKIITVLTTECFIYVASYIHTVTIAASNLAHNCTFLADVQVSFTLQMHVQWLSLLTRAFSKTFRQP